MLGDVTRSRVLTTRAFRWDLLPKVSRGAAMVARAAAAYLRPRRPEAEAWRVIDATLGGALGAAPVVHAGPAVAFPAHELGARLGVASWVAVRVRRADGRGFAVVLDGALAARLAARVLGDEAPELPAPRGATPAEKGVLAFLVAAALDASGADGLAVEGAVDDLAAVAALLPDPWVIGVDAHVRVGDVVGAARVLAPESLVCAPPPPPAPADLSRLDGVELALTIAAGAARLPARDVAALAPRDVVVLDGARRGRVRLRVASGGGFEAALADHALTILGPYAGDAPMPTDPADLPVDLVCRLGEVRLNARELLELGPGAVIPLGRPLGSPVELVAGGKVVARGELVDVEGELGVRVLSV